LSKKINVSQAQIKTATIEIKAITLSGKQMTLAVFRQLQNEDLIDSQTLQLKGVPWGIVNYHLSDCPTEEHYHIIWQKGNELRKAIVFKNFDSYGDNKYWVDGSLAILLRDQYVFMKKTVSLIEEIKNFPQGATKKQIQIIKDYLYNSGLSSDDYFYYDEDGDCIAVDENSIGKYFKERSTEFINIIQPFSSMMKQIDGLDQLFIAV